MQRHSIVTRILLTGASFAALASPALAQTVSEEIVVTAQKREQSIQDVPIAISAFGEEALETRQINDAQDIMQAIPNMQFSKQNFTGNNMALRGVGTKVVAQSGDQAVGIHVNSAPLGQTPIFETEFYDVSRVEVLRGPQGTLFGRNSSSGVFNIITARPELEVFSARVEGTYGNYNAQRGQVMVNIPVGDTFALRAAGFAVTRDGFTEDLATGEDVDGRDMWSARVSAYAELSDAADAHLMVQFFEEDSNRSRIGKQLCSRDTRAWPFSQGCLGAPLEFETVNLSATLGGLGALIFPGTTLGIPGLQPTLLIDPELIGPAAYGVNPPDLRQVNLTFQPTHQNDDFLSTFEFNWRFGDITFTSLSSYALNQVSSSVDYNQYIGGQVFQPTLFTPTGTFDGPRTGVQNTLATFDVSESETESVSQEFRLTSDFGGFFDFTLGGIYIDAHSRGTYQVVSNSLEAIGLGLSATPPPVPENQFFYTNETGFYDLEASALFGEAYLRPSEDLTFTVGLRYTSDDKVVGDRQTLLQRIDRNLVPLNVREASFEELTGRFTVDWKSSLPFTDETNWYASYARGYKGGGLNPPIDPSLFQGIAESFAPEFVNAYEIGAKNSLADGRITANFAGFYYEYEGYQITRIVNRTSVNANIDATVHGVEGEITWEPAERLIFNVNVGWLDSEIGDAALVDPINVAGGNAAYTNVSDALTWTRQLVFASDGTTFLGTVGATGATFTPGALPAGSVVRSVRVGDLANPATAAAAGAIVSNPALATISTAATCIVPTAALTGVTLPNGTFQGTGYAAALGLPPQLLPFACQLLRGFAGDTLAGADGVPTDISGNKLPNTPEWTVSVGAQYTFDLGGGWSMTPRADFYYQADSFARIFNGPNDALDSYSIWNATLRIEQEAGWYANVFVKNIADENVITDIYLTDQSSGLFSNAFLLEPRTYGITLGRRF